MSNDGFDGSYNNTHRAFLQSLLARQTITFEDAKPILAAIYTAAEPDRPTLDGDISQEEFENMIHALNNELSPFDLEIRSTQHQRSRTRVYALVNTTSDALTQIATSHSADEIAFVKRTLDAMFETYNTRRAEVMAITSIQALELAKGDATQRDGATQTAAASVGLTKSQAERTLSTLVAEGWYELSQAGYYSLSPRALMELKGWLIDSYNYEEGEGDDEEGGYDRIKFCQACREIVTIGQRCPHLACNARIHEYCVRKIFRAQQMREECPVCKTAWAQGLPVGEKASRNGRSGSGRRSTNGPHRSSNIGANGPEDQE
ncbi:DNA repair protein Nse1 [Acrodontium crateriforme]|uniref:Non-structural maintenance of chromosomes element 1 homolog n=1 Tax=Acrodontium crateriforme TaxID=150365 RepID=A0AAQ3M7H6_9PEZI|nr:DNA repair protein Nse1 [Acrodontium crateriforme]